MKQTPTALQGIFDIEPPPAPLFSILEQHALSVILLSLLFVFLSIAVSFFVWRRYFSVRGRARRQLAALQKHFNQQSKQPLIKQPLDEHHIVFQISSILRDGLRLTQLSTRTPFPYGLAPQKDHWEKFIAQLSTARYSPGAISHEQIIPLFKDAGFWLRHWPVANTAALKNDRA